MSSATARRRGLLLSATMIALTTGGMAGLLHSGAIYTNTTSVSGNVFTSGTVSLTTDPTSTRFAIPNMSPGSVQTAPLTVENSGSLQLRYAMESLASGGLAPAMTLAVKEGVSTCTDDGFAQTGTVLYAKAAPVGTTDGMKVFGDKATGPDTGDRVLDVDASETLCIQVTLPSTTGNDYANQTAEVSFNFYAEQTKNNGTDAAAPSGEPSTGVTDGGAGGSTGGDTGGSGALVVSTPASVPTRPTLPLSLPKVAPGRAIISQYTVPASVSSGVIQVAGGDDYMLALKQDGSVVSLTKNTVIPQPTLPSNIVAVAGGGEFSNSLGALGSDGTVYTWGPSTTTVLTNPAEVSNVVALDGGYGTFIALKADGTVVTWQAGQPSVLPTPAAVTSAGSDVVAVSGGNGYFIALKANGTVVSWISGSTATSTQPALTGVVRITGGRNYMAALRADGTVTAWKSGTATLVALPTEMATNVSFINGGAGSVLTALHPDGTATLFDGSTTTASNPAATATHVRGIGECGHGHNNDCILLAD